MKGTLIRHETEWWVRVYTDGKDPGTYWNQYPLHPDDYFMIGAMNFNGAEVEFRIESCWPAKKDRGLYAVIITKGINEDDKIPVTLKLLSKSEWFEFEIPLAEPDIVWNKKYKYQIERIVKEDGTVIWFGQNTNWVKKPTEHFWTYLGTDESVLPLDDNGTFPEERNVWIPCDPPIYEVMYGKPRLDC